MCWFTWVDTVSKKSDPNPRNSCQKGPEPPADMIPFCLLLPWTNKRPAAQQWNAICRLLVPFLPVSGLNSGEVFSCVSVSVPAAFWNMNNSWTGTWHTIQNEDMSGNETCWGYGWTILVKPLWGQRDFQSYWWDILWSGEQWSEKCQECLGHVYNSSRQIN